MNGASHSQTAAAGQQSSRTATLAPYLWALTAVALGVWLRWMLASRLGTALPFITLFPAIFISAYVGGLRPTLLATFLSILAGLYLFIEPVGSISLSDPVAQLGALLFGAAGVGTGWLGEARLTAHRQAKIAARSAELEAARAEQ